MSDKAITWGKIKVYDIQDSDLDTAEDMEFPFHPGSRFRAVNTGIDEPSVQINYEDFFPGQDIARSCPMMRCNMSSQGRPRLITGCRH